MSDTNKDINILRDKLTQVDTPPVDEAWGRMAEMIENPPIQSASLPKSGLRFYMILNGFIGLIMVASGVLLSGKSNDKSEMFPSSIEQSQSGNLDNLSRTTQLPPNIFKPVDHEADLPIPQGLPIIYHTHGNGNKIEKNNREIRKNQSNSKIQSNSEKQDQILPDTKKLSNGLVKNPDQQEVMSLYDMYDLYAQDDYEGDSLDERFLFEPTYNYSVWGVQLGTQIFPDLSPNNLLGNISGGFFFREYLNYRSALQLEAGFNSFNVRPISYVMRNPVGSVTQLDSSEVSRLQYLSLTGLYRSEVDKGLTLSAGMQLSGLVGVRGTNYQGEQNSQGTEYTPGKFGKLKNDGAIAKFDFALLVDVGYQMSDRIELGIRFQQSLKDFSTEKLGMNTHRYGIIQFRSSVILGGSKRSGEF